MAPELMQTTCAQISNGIAGYKQENPEVSDAEAVRALLPGTKWQMDESGELTMQMDGQYHLPSTRDSR